MSHLTSNIIELEKRIQKIMIKYNYSFQDRNVESLLHHFDKTKYRNYIEHFAIEKDHTEVIKYLIDKKLITSLKHCLKYSAKLGKFDLVKYILNFNIEEEYMCDALISASKNGHLDIVKYLVEMGTPIKSIFGCEIIFAFNNGDIDRVLNLVKMEKNSQKYVKPILKASRNEHLEVVKFLVSKGADIFFCNPNFQNKYDLINIFYNEGKFGLVHDLLKMNEDLIDKNKYILESVKKILSNRNSYRNILHKNTYFDVNFIFYN